MDITKLRNITNDYRDVRLISLKKWKHASEVNPRDQGGPYIIAQQGYDPQDMQMDPTDFVLGRSGQWVRLAIFFGLPLETRLHEFVFGTAAEVMNLLGSIGTGVRTVRTGKELDEPQGVDLDGDGLNDVVLEAKKEGFEATLKSML